MLFDSSDAFAKSSHEVQAAMVLEVVRQRVAEVLALGSADELDVDVPFPDLGMGSLDLQELVVELEGSSGLRFNHTALLEHATVRAVASHIHSRLLAEFRRP